MPIIFVMLNRKFDVINTTKNLALESNMQKKLKLIFEVLLLLNP